MPKMHGTVIALVLMPWLAVNGAPLENCVDERWSDLQIPPDTPDCVPYDGSKIPDCQYFLNNHTSFFHVHEHDCGKFWECSPEGPCLFECAACGNSPLCNGQDKLTFDCRYQYPEGPVCAWPTTVNCADDGCRDECCKDEDCPDGLCVDGSCVVNSCNADTDCTATECSSCVSNLCQDPTCCSNDECQTGDCVDGECPCDECESWQTCTDNGCTPECISDENCSADQWCDTSEGLCKPGCRTSNDCSAKPCSECADHQCADPECCSDEDCPTGYCADDGTCAGECDEDSDCSATTCSNCNNHACFDPACCSDDECESWQTCTDNGCTPECISDENCSADQWCDTSEGLCKPGCRTSDDCSAKPCSECVDHQCADPECCSDEDCPNGSCNHGTCEAWECVTESDCPATACSVCADHNCVDPMCCSDEDCPTGYCNEDGTCEGECDDDGDCQSPFTLWCSVCENFICSKPGCCTTEDCDAGFICQDNSCVKEGECDAERPCEGANEICVIDNNNNYSNCEWCDLNEEVCNPGCATNENCPGGQICSGHRCTERGVGGVVNITIATATCSSCAGSGNPVGKVEGGVQVTLVGEYGDKCTSNGLDNKERVDYDNGKTAFFDGEPGDDGDDDGLGGCKGADLILSLSSGSATWTGPGSWTAVDAQPICINFYDPDNNKPTCCCDLHKKTLATDETSELENCQCKL